MSCVFCELLSSGGPAEWVAREELAAAFLTLPDNALAPGHTLVIPSDHAAGIYDVTEPSLGAVLSLVQRVALAMRAVLGATGVNVLNASGAGSEQSVPHLHFHVVPRWEDDGFTSWPAARSHHVIRMDPAAALAASVSDLAQSPTPRDV
jgi:histidine triad (HIT) family protein